MIHKMEKNKGGSMKILCTGSLGMLGSAIKNVFVNHQCLFTDIESLDVRYWRDWEKYLYYCPDVVLHLAAMTDLEQCQRFAEQAYFTNAIGTTNAVEYCKRFMIPLVYISTAGVFDGKKTRFESYTEEDLPEPINHYGRSKYYGDLATFAYPYTYIFRNGWAFGGGKGIDKKFVYKIIQQFDNTKEIFALSDVYGSPTYTYDLAKIILGAIEKKIPYGTYNAAGLGVASRYDVAKFICEVLRPDIKVSPVEAGYFSDTFFCTRAQNEVLSMDKIQNQGIQGCRYWKNSLEEYLKNV